MRYEGTLYRPPSEAHSLIVQVTIGCAYNRCRFCTMYKDKRFRVRNIEDVKRDFIEAHDRYGDRVEKVFLADGDALILQPETMKELLVFIKNLFPQLKSITTYGSPKDILRHTTDNLSMFKQCGLSMVYMGAESGDSEVLLNIDKGVSREEIIEAGLKLKTAGIKSSITLISGLGGRERLIEHAEGSADLISRIKPDYVGFLTLMLDEGAPILQDINEGRLTLLSPEEVVTEMEIFLKHVDSEGTVFRANHASNYMMLKGTLNGDIPMMLSEIEGVKRDRSFRKEDRRRL
jgi:radical SAM superfamily enzyme YgiQ (UPF0313 family)